MWRKGNIFALLVGMQIGAATVESSMEIPQKILKMYLPFDPGISLQGIYLKEPKTLIQKNISTPIFIEESLTVTKVWEPPKRPSVDEWIKQLWYIHTMEYYSAIKKEILPLQQHG